MKKKIAAIIPTFNRKNELKRLHCALLIQTNENIELEIVVVVDGSTDGTLKMLELYFVEVHIVQGDGNLWYTKSMNLGFKRALELNPDYYLTLNDDVIPDRNYLQSIVNGIDNEFCIIGSVNLGTDEPKSILFAGIKRIIWWKFKFVPYKLSTIEIENRHDIISSEDLPGRGMLIPKEVVDRIGFFDKSFSQYGSDSEFVLRAKSMGISAYIAFDAILYTEIENTGKNAIYELGIVEFAKSFFNKNKKTYLMNEVRLIFKYGQRYLLPITLIIKLFGHLKNYIRHRL